MHRIRLAVDTSLFGQPLRQVVQLAAETGAEGVQFDARQQLKPGGLSETGRKQLLYTLSEVKLSVASLSFPLRRPLHDPERLDARVAALKQAMQLAWDLKARILTCRAGRIPDASSAELETFREVLSDLARHGNHVGVTLSITPAGDSPESLRELLQSIDDGPLGVDFDSGGCVMSRRDPVAALRELHAVVMHFTVRDALRDADGGGREAVVGRGEVDWDEMLALLDEMNYTGWLTVTRHEADDPVGDATRAIQYIRNVAGVPSQ